MQALDIDDLSVLDYVVRSDEKRENLLREAEVLEKALEEKEGLAAVRALRKVELERLRKKVEETRQIAERRSGARGKDTRKVLIQQEEELKVAKERVEGDVSVEEMSSETQRAAEMLTEVQTGLELVSSIFPPSGRESVLTLQLFRWTHHPPQQKPAASSSASDSLQKVSTNHAPTSLADGKPAAASPAPSPNPPTFCSSTNPQTSSTSPPSSGSSATSNPWSRKPPCSS